MGIALQTLAASNVDDDGVWAALCAAALAEEFGELDPDRLVAVLEGRGSLEDIPEPAAVALVERCADRHGPDAVVRLAGLDGPAAQRAELLVGIARLLDEPRAAAELIHSAASTEDDYVDAAQLMLSPLSGPSAARVTVELIDHWCPFTSPSATAASLHFRSTVRHLVGLLDDDGVAEVVASTAMMSDVRRTQFLAALASLALQRCEIDVDVDTDVAELADPAGRSRWLTVRCGLGAGAALDAWSVFRRDRSLDDCADALGVWATVEGIPATGPGSCAEAATAADGRVAVAAVAVLVDVAQRAAGAAGVDEVLRVATRDGLNSLGSAEGTWLHRSSPQLPVQVAVAVAGAAPWSRDAAASLVDAFAGRWGHRWSDDEASSPLDGYSAIAETLERELLELATWSGAVASQWAPQWLVRRSMMAVGLAAWVAADPIVAADVVARLDAAGSDVAAVAVRILDGFAGTPAELVDVASGAAP